MQHNTGQVVDDADNESAEEEQEDGLLLCRFTVALCAMHGALTILSFLMLSHRLRAQALR